MKTKIRIFGYWLLSLLVLCCTLEEDLSLETLEDDIPQYKALNPVQIPSRSDTELIVGFYKDVNDTYKKNLRQKYHVLSFERCDCTNQRIEKWTFAEDVDIEKEKGEIVQEGGVEGVDFQYYYSNENTTPGLVTTSQDSLAVISRIKVVNNGATIAILDTGLDISKIEGVDPFLHREQSPNNPCPKGSKEWLGWDFVNDDNDVYDDNGHGSIVASIIKSRLDVHGITDYQILPVKVFDAKGTGSTFDILCGYLFATEKPEVKMVNMSFGWYKHPSILLGRYMQQHPNVLHTASAGNSGVDTDQTKHYPSGYPLANIFSVGSFVSSDQGGKEIVEISDFSNYGIHSIDVLSVGEDILYTDPLEKETYEIAGTSYAAPFVTAEAMLYFVDGYRKPSRILNQIVTHAIPHGNTTPFLVKYGTIVVE